MNDGIGVGKGTEKDSGKYSYCKAQDNAILLCTHRYFRGPGVRQEVGLPVS
jgi:hypothetical protein